MKICIYGAGAIGGYLAADLARVDGLDVSVIARGAHLEAMKKNGLRLLIDGEERVGHPTATHDPAELGPQDVVIVALKAHQAWDVADQMKPLLGQTTSVVTCQNGAPWWYFYGMEGQYRDLRLRSVDPEDRQWNIIGPSRAIGCVVYPATEIAEPGVIKHTYGNKFALGEPTGEDSPRALALSEALTAAGFKAPVLPHIRDPQIPGHTVKPHAPRIA